MHFGPIRFEQFPNIARIGFYIWDIEGGSKNFAFFDMAKIIPECHNRRN